MDIFEEIEDQAEKFVEQMDFFRTVFNDLKTFEMCEFKVDGEIDEENIAKVTTNIFNFPEELFDLSSYVNDS